MSYARPLDFECPRCGRAAGVGCETKGKHPFHGERVRLAQAERRRVKPPPTWEEMWKSVRTPGMPRKTHPNTWKYRREARPSR